jgi:hypothetical protein
MITGLSSGSKFIIIVEKKNKDLYVLTVLSLLTLQPVLKFDYPYFRKESWPFIRFD